ncbi:MULTISPECIES: hypothetical protein [unclassified Streptomyces]|uniref:hypothetical protein n=1 Tax=unclassified Streptomyces TaxID=2593676 RepID=UPI001BE9F99D|nr:MULTISPECIES: hypothetical protein [unclassified Streptomyces]MBT2407735.1 hypothetical protein [Streptomyces sp. ISL-21]MBT2457838.1 hypothetical protein [Streptomyces sp. ISL-86]MBT2612357.1 hypothetical protein [Streptomyces sp. ISL-87]
MSGVVVVYELGQPVTGNVSHGEQLSVRRVHSAPAAPGTSVRGPRTMCGKDTFAMETAEWKPSGQPDSSWFAPEYADLVCPECDAAMDDR